MISFQWQLGAFGSPGQSRDVERALTRAVARSGSDTIRALRVRSNQDIRQRKRLKVSRINKSLVLDFPANKSEMKGLIWRMRVGNAPTPVIELGARQTKKGVTFGINKGAKRSLIRGAFIATMRSGHRGVFVRRGRARLPVDEAFTTRVSDVFKDEGFAKTVFSKAMLRFDTSFARLLPLELAKIKRP